jgi:hypothetical protein
MDKKALSQKQGLFYFLPKEITGLFIVKLKFCHFFLSIQNALRAAIGHQ